MNFIPQFLRELGIRNSLSLTLAVLGVAVIQLPAASPRELPHVSWWWKDDYSTQRTNASLEEIRAAALTGNPAAQYELGRAAFLGEGTKRNLSESLGWIRQSADKGFAPAEFVLGRFHMSGVATEQDAESGFNWVQRAASQNHPLAMSFLGRLYQFGDGVPRDIARAREWLQRAAQSGWPIPCWYLAEFHASGEAGSASRTNHVEAFRWYERAASNGLASAMIVVADRYRTGTGTPPDDSLSLYWTRSAVDKGSLEAMERLSGFYTTGLAEPRNPSDSPTALLRRAAVNRAVVSLGPGAMPWERRWSSALVDDCSELWNRYRFGIGTPRDYLAAAQWMWVAHREDLRKVAAGHRSVHDRDKATDPFATILDGSATALTADDRLWHEAVRLIDKALNKRDAEAWFQIGRTYLEGGNLAAKEVTMAWPWLNRASQMGHSAARPLLQTLKERLTEKELAEAERRWVPPIEP